VIQDVSTAFCLLISNGLRKLVIMGQEHKEALLVHRGGLRALED